MLVFLREKHQNSLKNGREIHMNFSFWPFLWFGVPGQFLISVSRMAFPGFSMSGLCSRGVATPSGTWGQTSGMDIQQIPKGAFRTDGPLHNGSAEAGSSTKG